jgi:hypothetical protein
VRGGLCRGGPRLLRAFFPWTYAEQDVVVGAHSAPIVPRFVLSFSKVEPSLVLSGGLAR